MRAISRLRRLEGISTSSLAAMMPLRIRVRKSAMGSVIDMALPARLRHPGDEALVRELAQADSADAELAVDRARAAAAAAARVCARGVLRRARLAHPLRCLGHEAVAFFPLRRHRLAGERLEPGRASLAREGKAQAVEQRERLGVG